MISHQRVVLECIWLIKTVLNNNIYKKTRYNYYQQQIALNGGKPKICYIKWFITSQLNSISVKSQLK
jgi:hypothetical protein